MDKRFPGKPLEFFGQKILVCGHAYYRIPARIPLHTNPHTGPHTKTFQNARYGPQFGWAISNVIRKTKAP